MYNTFVYVINTSPSAGFSAHGWPQPPARRRLFYSLYSLILQVVFFSCIIEHVCMYVVNEPTPTLIILNLFPSFFYIYV
jgi:hypothetical protein